MSGELEFVLGGFEVVRGTDVRRGQEGNLSSDDGESSRFELGTAQFPIRSAETQKIQDALLNNSSLLLLLLHPHPPYQHGHSRSS